MTDQYSFILRAYVDSEYIIENLDQKQAETVGDENAAEAAEALLGNATEQVNTKNLLENMCGHMVGSSADLTTLLEVYNVLFFGHLELRENVIEALTGSDMATMEAEDVLNDDAKSAEVFERRFKDLMRSMDLA
jgi:hypothetical protein